MAQERIAIRRQYDQHRTLTVGDLRRIVADLDRRQVDDEGTLAVNAQHEWVSGKNADGTPSEPYPDGHGGHYITRVSIRGTIPNRTGSIAPCPE